MVGVLSLGALAAGAVFVHDFESALDGHFWDGSLFASAANHVLHAIHELPGWVPIAPTIAMLVGFFVALVSYVLVPTIPKRFMQTLPRTHRFFLNKWYFDEIYEWMFVKPARQLGTLFWSNDQKVIAGLGPDGIAARVRNLASYAVRFQTGYLYHYAFVMLTGIAIFVTVMIAFDRGLL